MFINNLTDLLESEKLSEANYYYCDKRESEELIDNGFIPISFKDDGYIYIKNAILLDYLKSRKKDGEKF